MNQQIVEENEIDRSNTGFTDKNKCKKSDVDIAIEKLDTIDLNNANHMS